MFQATSIDASVQGEMQLAPPSPQRRAAARRDGGTIVVLSFPYDAADRRRRARHPAAGASTGTRASGGRRSTTGSGVHVAEVLDALPGADDQPTRSTRWLAGDRAALGRRVSARRATTAAAGGSCDTRAGHGARGAARGRRRARGGALLVAADRSGRRGAARAARGARSTRGARRCLAALERGEDPPPARLALVARRRRRRACALEVLWDPDVGRRLRPPAGRRAGRARCRSTRGSSSSSTPSSRCTTSTSTARRGDGARRAARRARRGGRARSARSRATEAEPIAEVAAVLGGELAAVPVGRRALRAATRGAPSWPTSRASARRSRRSPRSRPTTPIPAVVVCPASLKLNWERETAALAAAPLGRGRRRAASAVPPHGRDHDPQLRDRRRPPRDARAARAPALVVDESHYCKNPQAKRTQAVRRLAATRPARRAAPRADRHAGAQPRRGADRPAARDRAPRGLRLRRALRPPVPRRAHRGAPALAPAPALLRAAAEVRGAAAAAGQAPGRRAGRARQRARVPARRERRDRVAARAAAGPVASSTRRSPRRCAPSAWRSSATLQRLAARGKLARRAGLDPRLPRLGRAARRVRAPRRGPGGGARALPATRCTCSARDTIADARGGGRAPSRSPDGPQLIVVRDARRRPGHHADARLERRLPRARVDAGDARPGRGPLPPHRPARRGHRLVPAGRRHDRRDDGAADPAQARDRRRRHRRAHASTATGWSTRSCASCATASRSATCAPCRRSEHVASFPPTDAAVGTSP